MTKYICVVGLLSMEMIGAIATSNKSAQQTWWTRWKSFDPTLCSEIMLYFDLSEIEHMAKETGKLFGENQQLYEGATGIMEVLCRYMPDQLEKIS